MEYMYLLLLLSGLCSLSSCVNWYLHLVKDEKSWMNAQKYCRENCVDLATINDMEEMETLQKDIETLYQNKVWIGLRYGIQEFWHWSLAREDFYKTGERNYLNWREHTTNNCGSFQNGELYSVNCGTLLHAVCFDGKKQGRAQYILTHHKMSWMSAREHCRAKHTDLTSVRNERESQTVQDLVRDKQAWIGLFRDHWHWSDGSNSSFRYWTPDQSVHHVPSEDHCVYLRKRESGRWGQGPCGDMHKFICTCEKTVMSRKVFKVRISLKDSNLDPNDSAVKENILKHIKQQLSGSNVTEVQWRSFSDGRVFIKEPKRNQSSDCKL